MVIGVPSSVVNVIGAGAAAGAARARRLDLGVAVGGSYLTLPPSGALVKILFPSSLSTRAPSSPT
jgi:hypothetical protein